MLLCSNRTRQLLPSRTKLSKFKVLCIVLEKILIDRADEVPLVVDRNVSVLWNVQLVIDSVPVGSVISTADE